MGLIFTWFIVFAHLDDQKIHVDVVAHYYYAYIIILNKMILNCDIILLSCTPDRVFCIFTRFKKAYLLSLCKINFLTRGSDKNQIASHSPKHWL